MFRGAACFLFRGQRGGWNIKKRGGWNTSAIPIIPLILCGLSHLFVAPHAGRSAKIRGGDSDPPPKRGRHAVPHSCPMEHGAMPSPGGRYRPYLSLREGSENAPGSGARNEESGLMEWPKKVEKIKGLLSREAGPGAVVEPGSGDRVLRVEVRVVDHPGQHGGGADRRLGDPVCGGYSHAGHALFRWLSD